MTQQELRQEIDEGVVFAGYEENGVLTGVMGLQYVADVSLIRHAYVRTGNQQRGIGAALLAHLRKMAQGPLLIGTWADAAWAIRFYEKHRFHLVSLDRKDQLLKRYWNITPRQVETSVVLAEASIPE